MELTAAEKTLKTAKWARTMTRWLITRSSKGGVRWRVVDFNGSNGQESRGIVDLLAIRKKHTQSDPDIPPGDLFEMVLVQVKGGTARMPTDKDVERILKVRDHHRADRAVLVEWKLGQALRCYELTAGGRSQIDATSVFGKIPSAARVATAAAKIDAVSDASTTT